MGIGQGSIHTDPRPSKIEKYRHSNKTQWHGITRHGSIYTGHRPAKIAVVASEQNTVAWERREGQGSIFTGS
jgi:hypothetical protein